MAPEPFQYAVLRVVPRVEREEFINVGVIVFCRTRRFLAARIALDPVRLRCLHGQADPIAIEAQLRAIAAVAVGDPGAGASGLCGEPDRTLERLFARLVTG
jgi:hypothetical protein